MKKQHWLLIISGLLLFVLIFFFGNTNPPKIENNKVTHNESGHVHADSISFEKILEASKKQLSPELEKSLQLLEQSKYQGSATNLRISDFKRFASFWKDSAHLLLPFAYYTGLASKLENSEKSLTFAAHYFLEGLRQQSDQGLKRWMGIEAKTLFEQALSINPNNDSTKIGLGSCYLFAPISENPMQGIQLLREVSERDPNNIYAQFMLGLGGMQSGQYDKAIGRLQKVVVAQPQNLEAILGLAESFEKVGNKKEAIRWYTASKSFFNEKVILKEIDDRIEILKK